MIRYTNSLTLTALFILITFCNVSCNNEKKSVIEKKSPPESFQTFFEITLAENIIEVQLALSDDERQKGLMHRKEIGENQGMLFVFPNKQQMGFWMRNTNIPLDIGYFDSKGVLKEIYPMYPHDEKSIKSISDQIQFALEMNRGWFSNKGVRIGSAIEINQLKNNIEKRGFDSSLYVRR